MNYIITGPNGSIGSYLSKKLKEEGHYVCDRKIDYSSLEEVLDLFIEVKKKIKNDDVYILHTAFKNVRNYKSSTLEDYNTNIKMYENICKASEVFTETVFLLNFSSGVIYSDNTDYYTLAKKYISHEGVKLKEKYKRLRIFNIIIFGAFDPSEASDRFVTKILTDFVKTGTVTIEKDVRFSMVSYEAILEVCTGRLNCISLTSDSLLLSQIATEAIRQYSNKSGIRKEYSLKVLNVATVPEEDYCYGAYSVDRLLTFRSMFSRCVEGYIQKIGM